MALYQAVYNIDHTRFLGSNYYRSSVVAGALSRTTFGELIAIHKPPTELEGRFAVRRGGKARKEGQGRFERRKKVEEPVIGRNKGVGWAKR